MDKTKAKYIICHWQATDGAAGSLHHAGVLVDDLGGALEDADVVPVVEGAADLHPL